MVSYISITILVEPAINDAQSELATTLAELRKKFHDRVEHEIAKVTAADIAEALTKKILVTHTPLRQS
jgi:FKBP-type peptidyl-prolyl cis-trans isomerase (trigger factor)